MCTSEQPSRYGAACNARQCLTNCNWGCAYINNTFVFSAEGFGVFRLTVDTSGEGGGKRDPQQETFLCEKRIFDWIDDWGLKPETL
jgi:hypothetical protein